MQQTDSNANSAIKWNSVSNFKMSADTHPYCMKNTLLFVNF